MNKIRVLATKKFIDDDIAMLRGGFSRRIELIIPPSFSDEVIAEMASDRIHVLLGERISKEILSRASDLLLIQVPWTGVDRMNFELLRQYKIPVCNSHSNARIVAEMAMGLMFAITKKIPIHDVRIRMGDWMRLNSIDSKSFYSPTLLTGKTAGFIGFGMIARQIAQLLCGLEMNYIATDARAHNDKVIGKCKIHPPKKWSIIAANSDIIFITVPLLSTTRGLIEEKFFKTMKKSAFIINISRGEIVDEKALYISLKTRQIAGAAIDTWYQYPSGNRINVLPSARFPFHKLENIVMSPHRAGYSQGEKPHLVDVIENINRLADGKPLINMVDLNEGF